MTQLFADTDSRHEAIYLVAGSLAAPEAVARAAKYLETLTPLFKKSDPPGALTTPLTWSAIVQLQATFGGAFSMGPTLQAWVDGQVAARLQAPALSFDPVGRGMSPYPWQIAGAELIAATGKAYIFDEPRTGKTATAILGLMEWYYRHLNGWKAPTLVVCPASVVDPWVEAWKTWSDDTVDVVAWRGTPKQRAALIGTASVYVTSYETCRQDAPPTTGRKLAPLRALAPAAVVIDECHLIKNPQAARSQAVRRLAKQASAVVAMSGTPITHNPGDLWATLNAVEPAAQPSRERYVNRYCMSLQGEYKDEILGLLPSREAEFRLTMLGQHRRVARADVMSHLPPKVHSVRTVDLPAAWRKAYDAMESQMLAELPDGEELSVMTVLAQLTRLSQLASAPADVEVTTELNKDGEEVEHTKVTLKAPSWKVDALLEILEERPGEKVVVFAPSKQLIDLAGAAATKAGHRVGYIKGGQKQSDRTETIKWFQEGDLNLICATTGAGGVGITLSKAGTLVFLQRPWSLVESLQAEDRGEGDATVERGTEVIDIVARNTLDSRVRAVLRERAGQLADLVQDPRIVSELLGGTNREKAA